MTPIQISTQKLSAQKVDVAVIFVQKNISLTSQANDIIPIYSHLEELAQKRHFKGDFLDSILLPIVQHSASVQADYYLLIGLGEKPSERPFVMEHYRRAVGKAIRTVVSLHGTSVALSLPSPAIFNTTFEYLVEQTTIICRMARYHFDEFITQKDRKETHITTTILCVEPAQEAEAKRAAQRGDIIAFSVNRARHWIDSPPLHLTPVYLANKARHIAKDYGLQITVFEEPEIIKMGMGGLAAVSAGSEIDCQLVIMEYHTSKKDAPTLAFVGKGITFDSGGLSLKPAQSMETMKEDMSGAAAVIATMEVLAQLKPDVNIIALAPLSENLPSGKATKPGDIIKFYNGKTAEIKNTDAEGRLILADALSYAVKHYNPDVIIDLATLTGACAYALGPFYSGLMSQHDDVVQKIEKACERGGEQVWRLPMGDDYKKAIKSDVADICNIGDNRIKAGAITAAHFLQNFVGDTPWAHLDIAGTAFDVPNIPYFRTGATGVGIRMLVELAINYNI